MQTGKKSVCLKSEFCSFVIQNKQTNKQTPEHAQITVITEGLLKEVKLTALLLLAHFDVLRPRRYTIEKAIVVVQLCVTQVLALT